MGYCWPLLLPVVGAVGRRLRLLLLLQKETAGMRGRSRLLLPAGGMCSQTGQPPAALLPAHLRVCPAGPTQRRSGGGGGGGACVRADFWPAHAHGVQLAVFG